MSKDRPAAIRQATGAFCRSLLEAILPHKCFRALPQKLRSERRGLDRAWRRLHRRIERRRLQGTIANHVTDRVCLAIDHRFRANWQRICNYFIQPEQPVGIEGFLQEVGLA